MQFDVRVLKVGEGVGSVSLDAADAVQALAQAKAQGLVALSASPGRGLAGLSLRLRPRRFDLLQFSQELLALLSAGLSLPETVDTMVEKEARPETLAILSSLRDQLFEGRSFSQALQTHPALFDALYIATIRSSERSGDMIEALARYIEYQERVDTVRKKVVSASIYPAVLLVVGAIVTLFLLGYVVPRFSAIYAESGRELPLLSRLLLDWGQLLNTYGAWVLAVAAVAAVLLGLSFRRLLPVAQRAAARIPAIGSRMMVYHLARFYRTLGMLLRGGTPIVAALGLVRGLLPVQFEPQVDQATRRIREGVSISQAMQQARLTTPVAQRMLRIGESSGDMAAMMGRISAFHDEELARWVDWFTKLFEPLLMAAIGVVIGGIVVLMYMPIFELAGSLQ